MAITSSMIPARRFDLPALARRLRASGQNAPKQERFPFSREVLTSPDIVFHR